MAIYPRILEQISEKFCANSPQQDSLNDAKARVKKCRDMQLEQIEVINSASEVDIAQIHLRGIVDCNRHKFLRMAEMLKVISRSSGATKRRQFYLFEDLLVYSGGITGWQLIAAANMRGVVKTSATSFVLYSSIKTIKVIPQTENQCNAWVRALEQVVGKWRQNETHEDTAPNFLPNTDACMECGTSFSFFFRPHHCRLCGRCMCSTCLQRVSNQWRCKDPKQCEIRRAESLQPVTPRTAAARENIPAINFAKLGIEQLNDDGSSSKSGHWSKIDSETESSEDDHWQRRWLESVHPDLVAYSSAFATHVPTTFHLRHISQVLSPEVEAELFQRINLSNTSLQGYLADGFKNLASQGMLDSFVEGPDTNKDWDINVVVAAAKEGDVGKVCDVLGIGRFGTRLMLRDLLTKLTNEMK
eukprot:c20268_g2_i1.p1 GENE.c20268_g2_i1~~c20268_g2_i1.p1  ORF type:complete len:415 (+),score=76.49 c20268_g2_i1:958-2202(+)